MIEFTNAVTIESLIKKHHTLIINYYAEWCEPCKSIFVYLTELKNNFDSEIVILNVNVNSLPNIALERNVKSIPTLQYYKNGGLYLKESGFKSRDHLNKNIEALLNITSVLTDKT